VGLFLRRAPSQVGPEFRLGQRREEGLAPGAGEQVAAGAWTCPGARRHVTVRFGDADQLVGCPDADERGQAGFPVKASRSAADTVPGRR
jgi:hypothetical protein